MKAEDFDLLVDKIQNRCKRVLSKKSEEYAGDVDRLENFVRAGALQGESPAEALHGMLAKHEVSVAMMVKDPLKYSKKQWDGKITDAINYYKLLEGCLIDMGVE